jgi:hypothetical protein
MKRRGSLTGCDPLNESLAGALYTKGLEAVNPPRTYQEIITSLEQENERLKAHIHVQDKDAAEECAYLRGENERLREGLRAIDEAIEDGDDIAVRLIARATLQSKGNT